MLVPNRDVEDVVTAAGVDPKIEDVVAGADDPNMAEDEVDGGVAADWVTAGDPPKMDLDEPAALPAPPRMAEEDFDVDVAAVVAATLPNMEDVLLAGALLTGDDDDAPPPKMDFPAAGAAAPGDPDVLAGEQMLFPKNDD